MENLFNFDEIEVDAEQFCFLNRYPLEHHGLSQLPEDDVAARRRCS